DGRGISAADGRNRSHQAQARDSDGENTRDGRGGCEHVASIRLKFVKAYVDRHGKPRHYLRRKGHRDVVLPGLVGSEEFLEAYSKALADTPRVEIAARRTRVGSINAMVIGYLGSADFHNLAPTSQQQYRRILEGLRHDYGDMSIATLARKHVVRMLDAKAET